MASTPDGLVYKGFEGVVVEANGFRFSAGVTISDVNAEASGGGWAETMSFVALQAMRWSCRRLALRAALRWGSRARRCHRRRQRSWGGRRPIRGCLSQYRLRARAVRLQWRP